MKNQFKYLRIIVILLLISPFIVVWLPFAAGLKPAEINEAYWSSMLVSFRQLSVTLILTVTIAGALTVLLAYLSVLVPFVGKITAGILDAVESIPAMLIALFCYAPVSVILAKNPESASATISLLVFIFAATITTLPETVRGTTLPLGDLYHRKYSVSFRAYGFTKSRILRILLVSQTMRDVLKRTAASILLKTLVLDCSFGFIIQIGMGSYGTPAHKSPGALIAANRDAIFRTLEKAGRTPLLFWLPVCLLIMISLAFLLVLGRDKEKHV